MTRFLFAFALLAGAAFSAPAASAATPTVALSATALVADAAPVYAQGQVCFSQSGRRYCYAVPAGESCSTIKSRFDAHNAANPPGNRYRRFSCFDGRVATFNGQMEVEELRVTREGIGHDGDTRPPSGGHVGVFVTYVRDGELQMVEAGEGSDLGALLAIADDKTDCDRASSPFSVDVLTTEAPGTVRINGRRIEVEQTPVTVRATRADEYGEVIIHEQPLEDFEYD